MDEIAPSDDEEAFNQISRAIVVLHHPYFVQLMDKITILSIEAFKYLDKTACEGDEETGVLKLYVMGEDDKPILLFDINRTDSIEAKEFWKKGHD